MRRDVQSFTLPLAGRIAMLCLRLKTAQLSSAHALR
jgi:hypothetical protein